MEPSPLLIGGVKKQTSDTITVRFPYTGEVYAKVCAAGKNELDTAVAAACAGYAKTRVMTSFERSQILVQLADAIESRAEEFSDVLVREGGKTKKFATAEVARAVTTVRTTAEEAKRIYGEIIPLDWSPDTAGRTGYIRRFPIGPVVGIVPFNFPLNLACHKLAPAIAAGNSFILKPASATPVSGLMLGDLALEAGLPKEAVSVVPCSGAMAEHLVRDPRVAFLSFTGSPAVGWHLRSIAGHTRVGLELGGNAPAIIHEDANLDFAAGRIATGAFVNAGQVCISVQRVLIHRPVYDLAVEKILAATKALKTGDPRDPACDVGPMIECTKADEAYRKVQDAIKDGATLLCGGRLDGNLFEPTVLAGTTPKMRVNCEEVFAPVITVTPYDDFSEALRSANNSQFGLQAGIFTQNINRAMEAFAGLDVGGVIINDIPTFRVDQMPYGGAKASGLGREGPRYAIEEMTEKRLMVINRDGA